MHPDINMSIIKTALKYYHYHIYTICKSTQCMKNMLFAYQMCVPNTIEVHSLSLHIIVFIRHISLANLNSS